MDLPIEEVNYVKIAKIVLDVVPKYLRKCFIEVWNVKNPTNKWNSDSKSGIFLVNKIPSNIKNSSSRVKEIEKLKAGDEAKWDITVLVFVLLDAGLKLVEGSRQPVERKPPLRMSEEIEIIRDIRNDYYGHVKSMSCKMEDFLEIMSKITSVAENIFDEDAESEIEEIEKAQFGKKALEQVKCQLQEYYNNLKEGLIEKYLSICGTHPINSKDEHDQIIPKELDFKDFHVNLKIAYYSPPAETFKDETTRLVESFTDSTSGDIDVTQLTSNDKRITYIRGAAGIGKTVLAKKLAYDWAERTKNQEKEQFQLCIMFECRELNGYVLSKDKEKGKKKRKKKCKDSELCELFTEKKKCKLLRQFLRAKFDYDLGLGEGILIIADGMDELIDIRKSIITPLLTSNICSASKIIITGRPHIEGIIKSFRETGGLQGVEIQGLSDEQIVEYVAMFNSVQSAAVNLSSGRLPSQKFISILHIPHFLNTFCCIAAKLKGKRIRNEAELYTWAIFLLLKQDSAKQKSAKDEFSEIFAEYSKELFNLGKACYTLLGENKIVLTEEEFKRLLPGGSRGKEFIEGLFVDVADNFEVKHQFNHLTIMQFLCAIYICSRKDRLNVIKDHLQKNFIDTVVYSCQLIGGISSTNIIRELLVKAGGLVSVDQGSFLSTILEMFQKCSLERDVKFRLSQNLITCFLHENAIDKQLMIANIKLLNCDDFYSSPEQSMKLYYISKDLKKIFKCNESDLREAFDNFYFRHFYVNEYESITVSKYLKDVRWIILFEMNIKLAEVRSKLHSVIKDGGTVKRFSMRKCELEDDTTSEKQLVIHLDVLSINTCRFRNEKSFLNTMQWGASSFEDVRLRYLPNIEHIWWWKLIEVIEKNSQANGMLRMKKLDLFKCNPITKEMNEKMKRCGVEVTCSTFANPTNLICETATRIDAKEDQSSELKAPREIELKEESHQEMQFNKKFHDCKELEEGNSSRIHDDKEDVIQSLSPIRSEVKLIPEDGATMELYITGITLEVPKGAFTTDTIVELSILDPSSAPEYETDIGEAILGSIIRIGPASVKFNVPARLSIPYSIVDIPKYSSICMSYFEKDVKAWIRMSDVIDHDDENKSVGYAFKPGLYASCVLLDVDSHEISQSSTVVWPFKGQAGVKVSFDEKTFYEDQTCINFKINSFTERMCENFESAGMLPVIILHVEVMGNHQPSKPVTISLPFSFGSIQREEIMILQSDQCDDFKDVTNDLSFVWTEHSITLNVCHFTKFTLGARKKRKPSVRNLGRYMRNLYEVYVCVYEKRTSAWFIRVGCCTFKRRKEQNNLMKSAKFVILEFIKIRIHHHTNLSLKLRGCHNMPNWEEIQPITFKEDTIEFTLPLELQKSNVAGSRSEISICADGAAKEVVILLDSEKPEYEGPSGRRDMITMNVQDGGIAMLGNIGTISYVQSPENMQRCIEAVPVTIEEPAQEPTLTDMKDDDKFMEKLDRELNCSTFGNIKDLSLRIPLSYNERCSVLNSVGPSRSFFANLVLEKPNIKLCDLKCDLEESCRLPNRLIFKKIVDDINKASIPYTLLTTLGTLAADSQAMLYILNNIADCLASDEGTLLPTWKDIGLKHGYCGKEITNFCNSSRDRENKAKRLLSIMCAKELNFPISFFIEKLKLIGRNDIADIVETWQDKKLDAAKSNDDVDENPTISSLDDDDFVQMLGRELDFSSIHGIEELLSQFHFSNELSCHIITLVLPCHAFFENISIGQPELTLQDLLSTIEKCNPPNSGIFKKIDEDINTKSVSFSLDAQLGAIVDDTGNWLYILNTIANKLLPEDSNRPASWKSVAFFHGYEATDIANFEGANKGKESPTQLFMSFLFTYAPSYPVSDFVAKLKQIGREDIAIQVNHWLQKSIKLSSSEQKLPLTVETVESSSTCPAVSPVIASTSDANGSPHHHVVEKSYEVASGYVENQNKMEEPNEVGSGNNDSNLWARPVRQNGDASFGGYYIFAFAIIVVFLAALYRIFL